MKVSGTDIPDFTRRKKLMNKKIKKIFLMFSAAVILSAITTGCVKQNEKSENPIGSEAADNPKIVATSMSTVFIMEKLNLDLAGVPESAVDKLPSRYRNAEKIGMAMSPDMEKIKSLNPDWVFSPVSLVSDLQPKYENAGLKYGFLNLNNIPGMYKSIEDLGNLLNRKQEANKLIKEYEDYIKDFKEKNKNRKKPKVLILMGLPGSYVVATNQSYVGSLVELAGGINVFKSDNQQFININTEEMLKKDPDIILRTAHAMPDDVMKMFDDEFKKNDTWSHFRAVKDNKVFNLDYHKFGMSAKFNYPSALSDLEKIFYGGKN